MGATHPDIVIATSSLADTWRTLGRYDGAEELQGRAVDLRSEESGDEHPLPKYK